MSDNVFQVKSEQTFQNNKYAPFLFVTFDYFSDNLTTDEPLWFLDKKM